METTGPSVISMIWCWIFANSATIRDVGSIPLALIGIGLLTWRSVIAGRQARASEEQIALARQASLDGRYQKAADMLGSDLLSVRLGGIYGLTQLARGYPKEFHLQVIDLLATFVRHPPPIPEGGHSHTSNPREEVQTILEFFIRRPAEGRELEKTEHYTINLKGSNLSRANFLPGSNLEGIDLTLTNLTGALFEEVQGLTLDQLWGAFCESPEGFDQEKFEPDPPIFQDTYDSESGKSLGGLVLRRGARPRFPDPPA